MFAWVDQVRARLVAVPRPVFTDDEQQKESIRHALRVHGFREYRSPGDGPLPWLMPSSRARDGFVVEGDQPPYTVGDTQDDARRRCIHHHLYAAALLMDGFEVDYNQDVDGEDELQVTAPGWAPPPPPGPPQLTVVD